MSPRRALVVALVATAAAACSGPPAIDSCADRLSGIWAQDDGRRYHVVDHGDMAELHPLFDRREAADLHTSATVIRLQRHGADLRGHGQHYRGSAGATCRVRWQVRAPECSSARLVLISSHPGALDFADCSQRSTGENETQVALRLIEPLP